MRMFCEKRITVFEVKATLKVKNFIECLSVLCFLYHWSVCSQTVCLFTIPNIVTTRLSAFKMGISTGKNTVTCSIKTHIWGAVFYFMLQHTATSHVHISIHSSAPFVSWYAACMCIGVLLNGGEGEWTLMMGFLCSLDLNDDGVLM